MWVLDENKTVSQDYRKMSIRDIKRGLRESKQLRVICVRDYYSKIMTREQKDDSCGARVPLKINR